MKIFEINPDTENYISVEGKTKSDREKFSNFYLKSLSNMWIPPKVKMYKSNFTGDFYGVDGGTIIAVSEKSKNILLDVLGDTEYLHLLNNENELFALNILNSADILDEEKSEIIRFFDNRIMMILDYVFKRNICKLPLVFTLKGHENGKIFASEEFKKLIEKHKLAGLHFKAVWSQ